jgi:hypothetical protein
MAGLGDNRQEEIATNSKFLRQLLVFDDHVLEFAGFEDFTAFLAFNEFGVFFASHNLDTRMLAWCLVGFLLGEWRRRGWGHKSGF